MFRRPLLVLVAVLALAPAAEAADIQVTYRVDAKALKVGTPAGTPLTFQLYSDSACTTAAGAAQVVNVEAVSLIEAPKLIKVKGGPKPPSVAEINYTMTGIAPQPAFYAKVTGAGVTPVGGACQLQPGQARPSIPVLVDSNGTTLGNLTGVGSGAIGVLVRRAGISTVFLLNGSTGLYGNYAVYYTSSDCSGQPYFQDGLGAALAAGPGSTTIYSAGTGLPSTITVNSLSVGTNCLLSSFSSSFVTAVAVATLAPPFSVVDE